MKEELDLACRITNCFTCLDCTSTTWVNSDRCKEISDIAKEIFAALFYATCIYYHSYLFTLGFFTGVFLSDIVKDRLDRIFEIKNNSLPKLVGVGVFVILTAPICFSALSCWAGVRYGSSLINDFSGESG